MKIGRATDGVSAVGKPGTASQFQRRELVAVPVLRRTHESVIFGRNRLRHQRQVICMHWWDRLQPVNARLRAHFFSASEGGVAAPPAVSYSLFMHRTAAVFLLSAFAVSAQSIQYSDSRKVWLLTTRQKIGR